MNESKELALTCIHKGWSYEVYVNHCFIKGLVELTERTYNELTTTELA